MVKNTPKSLRLKRKAETVEIATPPNMDIADLGAIDFESSYLSICCLLQNESEASRQLVHQAAILSRMLEKLMNGVPKDIEELTLGSISNALSWISDEVVRSLVSEGLLEHCHNLVFRTKESSGRLQDRASELSFNIICDLVQLDDNVAEWVLARMSSYIELLASSPNSYPGVMVKRSCARLIHLLSFAHPGAFVPGLPESRLSLESTRSLFSLCNCPDTETACYITLSGLELERKFGSSVVPTSANISLDFNQAIRTIVHDACSFTSEMTSEEELRLSQWRSGLRGISTFVEEITENIEETLADRIESVDDLEECKFFVQANDLSAVDISLVSRFSEIDSLVPELSKLVSLLAACVESESADPKTSGLLALDDRDVENVFDLVGDIIRMRKLVDLRIRPRMNNGVVLTAVRLLSLMTQAGADVSLTGAAFTECLETVHTFTLSVLARQNKLPSDLLVPIALVELVSKILTPTVKQSIQLVRSAEIESDEEEIEVSRITVLSLRIVQMIFQLASADVSVKSVCCECCLSALSVLTEENLTVSTVCALAESIFVLFGESDFDQLLQSIDWKTRLNGVALFLNSTISGAKQSRNDQTQCIAGTVENIHAFIAYKG